jgi:hypothetical protein
MPGAALSCDIRHRTGWGNRMSDAHRYFMDHAIEAVRKARSMPPGRWRQKQRTVGRVYHLLAKGEAAKAGLLRRKSSPR